jgi:hypothetical protein
MNSLQVVMKIHNSCSDLTEEELAKMSVNLLNCQSAVEGRQHFPCTNSMVSCSQFKLTAYSYSYFITIHGSLYMILDKSILLYTILNQYNKIQ